MGTWKKRIDLTGQSFGRLTVVEYAGSTKTPADWTISHWRCHCVCGAFVVVRAGDLRQGRTTSCGCRRNEVNRTKTPQKHGHARHIETGHTREYLSWRAMHARCENSNDPAFHYYGGRGIRICERWQEFINFLADMGPRPPATSLDRWPNPDGNYEKGNCRWATSKEQANNKSKMGKRNNAGD